MHRFYLISEHHKKLQSVLNPMWIYYTRAWNSGWKVIRFSIIGEPRRYFMSYRFFFKPIYPRDSIWGRVNFQVFQQQLIISICQSVINIQLNSHQLSLGQITFSPELRYDIEMSFAIASFNLKQLGIQRATSLEFQKNNYCKLGS